MARFAQKHTTRFEADTDSYEHGYSSSTDSYSFISKPGLNEQLVREISHLKNEPEWMLKLRLEAYQAYLVKPLPTWGADLSTIDYENIHYYLRPTDHQVSSWDDVPAEVKATFDKLGIPQAERAVLAGVKAQYDSEVVYGSLKAAYAKDGVVFLSMDEGLREYPELVREYFSKIIPYGDNKFSALNTAVWSGGSFVYVPKGVHLKLPLQTYFRINAENAGQFERTLIILDEGSSAHYIEGCFVAGTPILTQTGLKPIESVEKTDLVLTHQGRYKKVNHTQVRPYSGKLYSISVTGQPGQIIEATEEHPFYVVRRKYKNNRNSSWQPEWLPISQVKKGDYALMPIDAKVLDKSTLADYFEDDRYLYVPIKSITSKQVENISVYNFGVEEDESYVAGGVAVHNCTAPNFSSGSLHSAVVEIYVKEGAQCQYTTIQNWYKNVYNLVTKRAHVAAEGKMIWTDFNMGSKVTMKYPGFVLAGKGAVGETLSMALAGAGQHQDTGSKAIHLAPYTSSTIISKSISKSGGRTSYRGLVNVGPHAHDSHNTVICDALLLDDYSRSDTYPVDRIFNSRVAVQHEATVSKIGDDQLFYLMSRGISEEDARKMVVHGFIDGLVKKLPLEYAVEMNRLIDHEMEGSIG